MTSISLYSLDLFGTRGFALGLGRGPFRPLSFYVIDNFAGSLADNFADGFADSFVDNFAGSLPGHLS